MDEQRKLFRIFQLISRLRSPLGCAKNEVARDFEVSERTIERYFELLRDLGFEIEKTSNRFRIKSLDKRDLKHEEMIVFSLEEAVAIRDAVLNCAHTAPLQKSLMDKLYALTELDELAETIYNQSVSRNINALRTAMRLKQQVLLKSYHAVSQQAGKDYVIEPIRFYRYFGYFMAYDVRDRKVKQFKTERITDVEITGMDWMFEKEHENCRVDVFGMTGHESIDIKLMLSKRARLLMEEELPDAIIGLKKAGDKYIYEGEAYSLKGVGRFVMGLIDEIEVLEPIELIEYLSGKAKVFLGATSFDGGQA